MASLGILAKAYRNTASYGTPTWVEIDKIADLAVNPSWDEAEGGSRDSRVKKIAKTMLGIEITGRIKVDTADAGYIALRDAMYTDIAIDLLILNGASDGNGNHGWRADWHVFEGGEDQAMGNRLYMDFVLRVADTANDPKYAEVSGGAPTFTDPGATS
jgi:hypothetical protein